MEAKNMEMNNNNLIIPENYKPGLNIRETEVAIKELKDFFERRLAEKLNLTRVSAPLFVSAETGLNDNLNGIEQPVAFNVKDIGSERVEIVQSLAKWKRMALYKYDFSVDEGIYTDMNAIRQDEILDNLHSIYVDQWDWEKVINRSDRNLDYLKIVVNDIYQVFKDTEKFICDIHQRFEPILPEEITFITTQQLENKYPRLSPEARENKIVREKGAVFLMQIGSLLESGIRHDGRAPDYDDWELNGDIIFWNPLLELAFELSSMGIRVDEDSLKRQLEIKNCEERKKYKFHRMLLEQKLPYTIGGGIGQSRICMFFLRKAHIGEVQAGIWSEDMKRKCKEADIHLL